MLPNPFDSLYMGENVDPQEFVQLFSPLVVNETLPLYQQGNVVMLGTQGTGKSMLLGLLKPQVRLAYAASDRVFPLSDLVPPFVGAGINLTRSGSIDFGQRQLPGQAEFGPGLVSAFFADFLNYWIVRDLILSVRVLEKADGYRAGDTPLGDHPIDAGFVSLLANNDCWVGMLAGVKTVGDLEIRLENRIRAYRNFLNFNSADMPQDISESKTSAGEPIAVAADALRQAGVLAGRTQVLIRIDQYEELVRLDAEELDPSISGDFGTVVHKMLGLRDPRVSYKIGTRRHTWPESPLMHGTTAVLEESRNYKFVDLDAAFRAGEHSASLFRSLADDVFLRRTRAAGFTVSDGGGLAMRRVFGRPQSPEQLAHRYAAKRRSEVVGLNLEWPPDVVQGLEALAQTDPLSAILGGAWLRQQYARGKAPASIDWEAPPWMTRSREWWRKERRTQALLQLAARQRQRMIWSGDKVILDLAGNNILCFVSLCQCVFDAWLRTQAPIGSIPESTGPLPELADAPYLQDQGIREASDFWVRKIASDPDGTTRLRFVETVGMQLRKRLRTDLQMSYPGHNGFSLDPADLQRNGDVYAFLRAASAFGVLTDSEHTSRNRGGGRRIKWYLHPMYAPHFQLPTAHQKEPLYVDAATVRVWMTDQAGRSIAPSSLPGSAGGDQLAFELGS